MEAGDSAQFLGHHLGHKNRCLWSCAPVPLVGVFLLHRYCPQPKRRVEGTFGERWRYNFQTRSGVMSNPRTETTDNAKKDPDEWFSGDDPMTGGQAVLSEDLVRTSGHAGVSQ